MITVNRVLAVVIPVLAWYCLPRQVRIEAEIRARLAGRLLRGLPVAYRVKVSYTGPGPAFEVSAPYSALIGCSVVMPAGDPD